MRPGALADSGRVRAGMGYSVRSDGWRYTIWVAWNGEMLKPVWEAVQGVELYQHSTLSTDFDGDYSEPLNRAVDPDSEAQAVMKSLHAVLVEHFSNDGGRVAVSYTHLTLPTTPYV